jgi:hypothetical protein
MAGNTAQQELFDPFRWETFYSKVFIQKPGPEERVDEAVLSLVVKDDPQIGGPIPSKTFCKPLP